MLIFLQTIPIYLLIVLKMTESILNVLYEYEYFPNYEKKVISFLDNLLQTIQIDVNDHHKMDLFDLKNVDKLNKCLIIGYTGCKDIVIVDRIDKKNNRVYYLFNENQYHEQGTLITGLNIMIDVFKPIVFPNIILYY